MTDHWLEQEAVEVANRRAGTEEDYRKAVITSYDWQPVKDKHGKVTGRKIHMQLYSRTPTGICRTKNFTFKQRLKKDSTYADKLVYMSSGHLYPVICE
jgi:hypothetical protein